MTPRTPKPSRQMMVEVPVDRAPPPTKRRPGRPRKVQYAPTASEAAYRSWLMQQLDGFINHDELVQELEGRPDSDRIVEQLLADVATEAARLKWDRIQAFQKDAPDAERCCSRRVAALAAIARLVQLRQELGSDVGPSPDQIETLKSLFVGTIRETAEASLPADMASTLVTALTERLAADERA